MNELCTYMNDNCKVQSKKVLKFQKLVLFLQLSKKTRASPAQKRNAQVVKLVDILL